jgi:uncharacterized tellurite resistance protein B-like protein
MRPANGVGSRCAPKHKIHGDGESKAYAHLGGWLLGCYARAMLFRWLLGQPTTQAPTATDELRALVARSMPGADHQAASIVGAVAGLCATVAYADRAYTPAEKQTVRTLLARAHDLPEHAVEGICDLLDSRLVELAHESIQTYTRVLYEGTERSARLEVLDVLVDLAAADEQLDREETNLLRRIATGLGLSEDEYVTSQARHRARLSLLRGV